MDILRKMFKVNSEDANGDNDKGASAKDEFRKPQWFEESESDDELFDENQKFAFQVFTNPMELQKHFERQMQQILEAVHDLDEDNVKVHKNLKEEYLKPGFEKNLLEEFKKQQKGLLDTDLDGEIYADQLHSLMQRLSPEDANVNGILPRNDNANRGKKTQRKLSDEETILGRIHGTLMDDEARERALKQRHQQQGSEIIAPPIMPRGMTPYSGIFEGTHQGPKMFRQSVMTKTVRMPDGTYETTKISQDSEGNKTTTITRTKDGRSETVTKYDGKIGACVPHTRISDDSGFYQVYSDRNIYVTKEGYAVPRNLW